MALTTSLPRCPRIALAAIVAALLAADVASASTVTPQDCTAKMKRQGCCCPKPLAGGCCCEPAPSVDTSGDVLTRPARAIGQASRTTVSVEVRPTGGTCQCPANDPVAPAH